MSIFYFAPLEQYEKGQNLFGLFTNYREHLRISPKNMLDSEYINLKKKNRRCWSSHTKKKKRLFLWHKRQETCLCKQDGVVWLLKKKRSWIWKPFAPFSSRNKELRWGLWAEWEFQNIGSDPDNPLGLLGRNDPRSSSSWHQSWIVSFLIPILAGLLLSNGQVSFVFFLRHLVQEPVIDRDSTQY